MDADTDRCAAELSDARVDVLGYACLGRDHEHGEGLSLPVRGAAAASDRS
jgi:maleate cis-trans isomerase